MGVLQNACHNPVPPLKAVKNLTLNRVQITSQILL